MSRLDDLITEFCPDGVEYKMVNDICLSVCSGGTPRSSIQEYYGGEIPWLRTQEVDYKDITDTGVKITNAGLENSSAKWIPSNCVIVAMYGASAARVAINKIPLTTNQACCNLEIDSSKALYKYVYYWFSNEYVNIKSMSEGAQPNLNAHKIKEYPIPVPPLPVQQEIVRILDKFTALEADLEVELETELEARKKQYEYYRDELFTFSNDVEWKTLGGSNGIADIGTGSSNTVDAIEDGHYPFYVRSADILKINIYEFDEEAIITSGDGVGVGKILHYVNGKFGLHQRAYRIRIINNDIMTKYVYHLMKSNFERYILGNAVNSSVTSVRKPMLEKYPVPVPSLAEQERIVAILDRFDALVNDITQGLPAEIAARRKQYEYYRDKLLTFKEAVS